MGLFSKGRFAYSPGDSPLDQSRVHYMCCLNSTPFATWVPFLCHFPTFLLICPRITSQIDSVPFSFGLRLCSWGSPNLMHSGFPFGRMASLSRSGKVNCMKHRAHSKCKPVSAVTALKSGLLLETRQLKPREAAWVSVASSFLAKPGAGGARGRQSAGWLLPHPP